jgi:arylsulfatase A-like enzyme
MLSLLIFASLPAAAPAADPPPNFVVIFADDLGYGDLGSHGHPTIRTPALDRMAAEGMRFTQFYSAASVCTPSRAALLTGRLPVRTGLYSDRRRVLFPDSLEGIRDEEVTVAEVLRARGYATACIGKWHLGCRPEHLPARHGFDFYYGLPYSNDMASPASGFPPTPLYRNEEVIEQPADQDTLTRRYTEEALRFIEENRARPFFLYLPHTFPHVPLHASEDFRGKSPRGLYGDVVEELDASTGRILEKLREAGLAGRTLVFFTSDNGPWLARNQNGGSAGLLREGKGSTWEGGMRVPGIAWWPGKIRPGEVSTALGSTLDLFPTILALAGVEPPADRVIDGKSLAPALLGTGPGSPTIQAPAVRDTIHYYRGSRLMAVRKGPWKAHFITQPGYGGEGPREHDPPLLFHLERDPSEKYDVAARHPRVVAELLEEAARQRAAVKPARSLLESRRSRV